MEQAILESPVFTDPKTVVHGDMHVNITEIKARELDELIDLAEKVSNSIAEKKNKITNSYILSLGLLIVLVAIVLLKPFTENVYLLFPAFFSFAIWIYIVVKTGRLMREVGHEKSILDKLLNMIHHHKENLQQDISIVSKAIYEMRLSRINFSF